MQLHPIKPKLKAHGTKRLKLKHEDLLSNLGFKFSLRRYIKAAALAKISISVAVGQCRLTL